MPGRHRPDRPERVFDPMLQHERTALAWERTAIAVMVTGVLFARQATEIHESLAVLGGVVLIWAGWHYDDLHAPLRRGQSPVHPGAARIVGLTTIVFIGAALIITVATVAF